MQKTTIRPPVSQIGPITPQERARIIAANPVSGQYDETVDRESVYEKLTREARQKTQEDKDDE